MSCAKCFGLAFWPWAGCSILPMNDKPEPTVYLDGYSTRLSMSLSGDPTDWSTADYDVIEVGVRINTVQELEQAMDLIYGPTASQSRQ